MALVSLPDYDPNYREQALDKDRLNRITSGVYEMGSVFKVLTVAGALDVGSSSLRSSYDASQSLHVGKFTIEDFHGKKRRLTVPEIFIYSSNIGAARRSVISCLAIDLSDRPPRSCVKKVSPIRE